MTIEIVRDFLGWCAVLNIGLLLWWFLFFIVAREWMYRLHSRWFKISSERYDEIHFISMAFFKLSIFLFNLIPYLALRVIA